MLAFLRLRFIGLIAWDNLCHFFKLLQENTFIVLNIRGFSRYCSCSLICLRFYLFIYSISFKTSSSIWFHPMMGFFRSWNRLNAISMRKFLFWLWIHNTFINMCDTAQLWRKYWFFNFPFLRWFFHSFLFRWVLWNHNSLFELMLGSKLQS